MLTHEGTLGISTWYWRHKTFSLYYINTHGRETKTRSVVWNGFLCWLEGGGFIFVFWGLMRWDINTDEYESHNVFGDVHM